METPLKLEPSPLKNRNEATVCYTYGNIPEDFTGVSSFLEKIDPSLSLKIKFTAGNIKDISRLGMLSAFPNIHILILHSNRIEDVSILEDLLMNHPSLLWIHLGWNLIEDISPIARGLAYSSLTRLILDGNRISDVTAIAEGLKYNTTLRCLSLRSNRIQILHPLGEALKHNNTLITLILSRNRIMDLDGLVDGLKRNRSLTELDIRINEIESEGRLAEVVKNNTTLKFLYLSGSIYIVDYTKFIDAMDCNPSLEICDIGWLKPYDRNRLSSITSRNRHNTLLKRKSLFEMLLSSNPL